MTLRYQHLSPEHLQKAMRSLDVNAYGAQFRFYAISRRIGGGLIMELSNSRKWIEEDLVTLITNKVRESVELDYKKCPSLQKNDSKKDAEISKDVSAFANSAGGIIVYGMEEVGHIPTQIDFGYDPAEVTKEWLEQVIRAIFDLALMTFTSTKCCWRERPWIWSHML